MDIAVGELVEMGLELEIDPHPALLKTNNSRKTKPQNDFFINTP